MRRALIRASVPVIAMVAMACSQSTTAPASAGPTPTGPASEATTPSPTPTRAAAGALLFEKSGSGDYRSDPFTARGEWDLSWEGQSAPNTTGSFVAITVFSGDGTPVASTIEIDLGPPNSRKNGVVHMHYAGSVSIDIQGVGSWHVKAVGT